MRIYYLAGVILSVTTILSACGESAPTECTITTTAELRKGLTKLAKFAPGTDCEAMRKLAEEGKPIPSIADASNPNTPKPTPTTVQAAFKAPFVSGLKGQELIPTTDKQARVKELEQKIGADSKQSRDPFTSTVINPVPRLETLLAKPKEQPKLRAAVVVRAAPRKFVAPPPPDTKAADATSVTGTVEISGTIYAILTAGDEPTARYVKEGQLISNGKVLIKRIDTNSEPPIVVLQQNGVEVLRPVGALPVVAAKTTDAQTAPTTSTTPTPTTKVTEPAAFVLPSL